MKASLLVLLAACVAPGAQGRFRDQPIIWVVDDARDIAEPRAREFPSAIEKVTASIAPPTEFPALNTNALDEVPDSTWFKNRLGRRAVSAAEALAGPNVSGPPQLPMRVVEGKIEGKSPGFLVRDTRGIKYLIKFDRKANPEQQTAAEVIVSRILWTVGYNVPSNHLVFFTREQLGLEDGIVYRDPASGNQVELTGDRVDEILSYAPRRGTAYRAVASEILSGNRKGGWLPKGVRADDPNDRVAHEYRRELRGLRVISAWVGHTDMTRNNTLDMYVRENGRRFLRHYLLDFGGALGGQQSELGRKEVGWEHAWDKKRMGRATLSFGMWTRGWEKQSETQWKSMGYFSARDFDPTRWLEFESYEPFRKLDRADGYWAAKVLMRFDRELLGRLIDVGEFSEPGAASYLLETLLARRNRIGAVYFEAVTPLDEFQISRRELCATDLSVKYALAEVGVVESLDPTGAVQDEWNEAANGRVCVPIANDDQYRILRLRVRRKTGRKPVIQIHYKGAPTPRILGVIRVGNR